MIRNLRWYIAGMLMLATTISYLDRQSLAIALPVLRHDLNLTSEQYSNIVAAFMIAYGVLLPISGRMLDWIGVKRGLLLSILWWSAASCGHAFARGATALASMRFLLGMGEAGNFPAGIKAISEWFPPKERAMATGIFNLGAGTGAVLAPPLVGYLLLRFGWQAAFLITSSIGFVWAAAWFILYDTPEKHSRLSPAELAHIRSGQEHCSIEDPRETRGAWSETFSRWEIWPVMAARVLTDPVWLFYIMWLPDYLNRARGFDLKAIALFAWIPFLAADAGSLIGGGISSWFVKRGWPTLKARKAAMCLCASLMPVSVLAVRAESPTMAIIFISVATFSGQSWGASFLTLPADLFPKRIVGSAYGVTAACGFLAGAAFTLYLGRVVDTIGYIPVFTCVGFMHLLGTAILVVAIRPVTQPATVALVPEQA